MKKIALVLSILALSACSKTQRVTELPLIPADATQHKAASYITATCAGFAKAGAEKKYGTELKIFNDCMDKAIEIIENSTTTTTE